jgi:catechol 2,3-dioxygenase-like lactoylglutathione lyase family enzyme
VFNRIGPTLPASDIDRARAFYRDTLGLEPAQETGGGGARYRVGDTEFMLYPSQFAGTNRATAAAFMVADAEAAVAGLRSKGVVFADVEMGEAKTVDGIITMPDGSKGAWFTDSEGNILGVFQEPPA